MPRLLILSRATAPERAGVGTIVITRAERDDAPAFARDIGTYDEDGFRARLAQGIRCYLAIEDGRVLHSSWCSSRPTWTEELQTYLAPPAGDAYVYESLTVPAARGRGIYPAVLRAISAELHSEGIGRLWIGVDSTNEASVKAIRKSGFVDAFSIAFEREGGRVTWDVPPVDPAGSLHIVTEPPPG